MSGHRSAFFADLRKIVFDPRLRLLPVLLSICLTQYVWVNIYDCKVGRSIFHYTRDAILNGIEESMAIEATRMTLVSGLLIAVVLWHFKIINESLLTLTSFLLSIVVSGTILHDSFARLPFEKVVRLWLGVVATVGYGVNIAGLAFLFPPDFPTVRCRQIFEVHRQTFEIINGSWFAVFLLISSPGSRAWYLLAAVALWDFMDVLQPFEALQRALQNFGAKACRFLFSSPVAVGDVADEDDDDAVEFARPARRLAAGRDHQQPRALGKNILRTGLEDIGRDIERRDVQPVVVRVVRRQSAPSVNIDDLQGTLTFSSFLVGSSMAVGVLPAVSSTIGVLVGVAFAQSLQRAAKPITGMSIVCGMAGHCIAMGGMAAIEYVV